MRRADEVQGEKEIGWDEGLWLQQCYQLCVTAVFLCTVHGCDMYHVCQIPGACLDVCCVLLLTCCSRRHSGCCNLATCR